MDPLRRQNLEPWFFASLLFHLALLVFFTAVARLDRVDRTKPLEVQIVELHEDPEKKQIVDIPEWGRQEKPERSRFLSQHDQRVQKETKAPRQLPNPWDRAVKQGKAQVSKPSTLPTWPTEPGGKQPVAQDPLRMNPLAETDFLPDVELGEKTYLNAEAFKHTGYYLEIKRKIELAWNPMAALREIMGRGISVQRGMLATYLGVTLTEDGSLERIVVLRSSGVPGLDREAERAFRVSAPFTRVPTELLTADRRLRFEFGFIVGT